MKKIISIVEFIIFTMITLVFYELFFGFAEISEPSHYLIDEKLGYVLKPSEPVISIEEGLFIGQSNEFGYWGYGYPQERTPNSIRFAMIGDSHVAGLQLPAKYHFRTIFENKLQELTNKKIEVLNFGRSGHHIDRMLIQYYEVIQKYNPDFLLVFLTPKDFLTREDEIGPAFYVEGDSLKIDYSFNKSRQYNFLKSIEFFREYHLYSLVQKCWVLFKQGETGRILFDKFYQVFKKESNNSVETEQVDNYYEINKAIINSLGSINKRGDTKIIIIIRETLPEKYNEIIAKNNLAIINLDEYMKVLKNNGYSLNYWKATNQYGHWNFTAQVFIGEYLAKNFAKKLNSNGISLGKQFN